MSAIQRRKRRPNGGHRKDTPDVKIMKSMDSFARSISSIDYQLTQKCSICARPNSQLGSLRPVMKVLEISCHGIPWLLGTIGLLLSVHKQEHLVVLMNLLIGKIYTKCHAGCKLFAMFLLYFSLLENDIAYKVFLMCRESTE